MNKEDLIISGINSILEKDVGLFNSTSQDYVDGYFDALESMKSRIKSLLDFVNGLSDE